MQVESGSKSFWNVYSKQQQTVLAYVQQVVYSTNAQCNKQYGAVAASSAASSSSSSTSSPTRTYSKPRHRTTTTTVEHWIVSIGWRDDMYGVVVGKVVCER